MVYQPELQWKEDSVSVEKVDWICEGFRGFYVIEKRVGTRC